MALQDIVLSLSPPPFFVVVLKCHLQLELDADFDFGHHSSPNRVIRFGLYFFFFFFVGALCRGFFIVS